MLVVSVIWKGIRRDATKYACAIVQQCATQRARAQSLATVLVLESTKAAALTIFFDCEHRFAEHEHEHD